MNLKVFNDQVHFFLIHSIEDWEEGSVEQSHSGTQGEGGSPPDMYFSEGKSKELGEVYGSS